MIMGSLVAVALVLACLGAGGLILTSPGPRTRPHADGVAGLTGLALLTWLAGWLVFAWTHSATAGWLLLGLGGSMLVLSLARGGAEPSRALRSSSGGLIGALVLALLSLTLAMSRTISEFAVPIANLNDDLPGYWHFPRLLLESGVCRTLQCPPTNHARRRAIRTELLLERLHHCSPWDSTTPSSGNCSSGP